MFFTAINQMMTEGVDLTIVIRKANGQMAVSTLPKSNGLKDEAQNHIVPLTVSGLPEELDAGFLQTVARPIQKVAGLITNMAQFEAQADKRCRQQGGEGRKSQRDEGGEGETREVREASQEGGGTDCRREAQRGCHRTRPGTPPCQAARPEED